MRVTRWFWLPWFITIIVVSGMQRTSATVFTSTTKEDLNFEINGITLANTFMTINGWAYINTAQHFRSALDHSVWLELISPHDQQIIAAQITKLSMTTISSQIGLPTCNETTFFSKTCNYVYDYVGFTVVIDLLKLKKGEHYTANLLVSALTAMAHRKTPLYYPIQTPITIKLGDYLFSAVSSLNDTHLRIVDSPVYVRKEPSKTSAIWASGTSCSTNYTNRLYFKYGAVFNSIINRYPIDFQTYYAMSGKLDVCVDGRRRIVEGSQFSPVWISSLFVEYSGTPLTIRSTLINTSPTISAHDWIVQQGDMPNLLSLATAFDTEEGDLSHKIIIKSSNYADVPGIYSVTFSVSDKYGYTGEKTITITVKEANNSPPSVRAFNRSILQYSPFDALFDVSAIDPEEGIITNRIVVLGEVDTTKLGDYVVCYSVSDSKGLSHEKCVIITVYNYIQTTERYRSISLNKPFHKELIPSNWKEHVNLISQIKRDGSVIISKFLERKPR